MAHEEETLDMFKSTAASDKPGSAKTSKEAKAAREWLTGGREMKRDPAGRLVRTKWRRILLVKATDDGGFDAWFPAKPETLCHGFDYANVLDKAVHAVSMIVTHAKNHKNGRVVWDTAAEQAALDEAAKDPDNYEIRHISIA